jgi:hypothetical protein
MREMDYFSQACTLSLGCLTKVNVARNAALCVGSSSIPCWNYLCNNIFIFRRTTYMFIACIAVSAFFLIAFCVTPSRVFTASLGRNSTALYIALAVINMFSYLSSILWLTMINVFYVQDSTDWNASLLSTVQGLPFWQG